MAWRSAGSFSRSVISAARAPLLRSPPPLPRLRPPTSSTPRLQSRRLSFAPSRYLMSRVQLDEGVRDSFVLWESAAKSSE